MIKNKKKILVDTQKRPERREIVDNVRKYLVNQLAGSGSLEQFDLAEALLVMYDTGVVTAPEWKDGEPLFLYNQDASNEQRDLAEKIHTSINEAANDVWRAYVYQTNQDAEIS
jgi:hypothetical protein